MMENLLDLIGFTKEEQAQYHLYNEKFGEKPTLLAEAYMQGEIAFEQALESLKAAETEEVHVYTLNLLFLLACSDALREKYKQAGIEERHFVNAMKDVTYKLHECLEAKGQFGVWPVSWYKEFFTLERVALGRLQYDIKKWEQPVQLKNYSIEEGEFRLGCHIPSSGPLTPELCMESLRMAYDFFKDRFKNGIMTVRCGSWMLYPHYVKVFGEGSNLLEFVRNFELIEQEEKDFFTNSWRIFGKDYMGGDVDELPDKTSLQRNFKKYIKEGGSFGAAVGVLLFDGKKVLNRREV